jgi:hypothetical protein
MCIREGFYRGASVAFGLLAIALLIRGLTGSTLVVWNGSQAAIPRSLLLALVAFAILASMLMVSRFHRFAQHRVKHALVSFLWIHKIKRAPEAKNA